MPIRHVGFTHIQKQKHWLFRRRGRELGLNPSELITQAPGVARELKALKRCRQHGTGFASGVEPIHSTAADGAVALTAEALNHIHPLEAKALLAIASGMASEGHAKELAGLGVEPGLLAAHHTRGEPHPEGGVAAIGEVAGG